MFTRKVNIAETEAFTVSHPPGSAGPAAPASWFVPRDAPGSVAGMPLVLGPAPLPAGSVTLPADWRPSLAYACNSRTIFDRNFALARLNCWPDTSQAHRVRGMCFFGKKRHAFCVHPRRQ